MLLSKLGELPDAHVDDKLWALTELVTKRKYLVKAGTAIRCQLHTHLFHNYPSYKKFFSAFDCKTALAFWEKYPSPSKLGGVSIMELTKFLDKESHNVYGIKKACEILNCVEEDGFVEKEMQDINDFIVSFSVNQLRANNVLIASLEEHIQKLVPEFGYKLHTMKGINYTTAAALIVEIGDIDRFKSAAQLAAYAGISPVEYSSGQSEKNFSNKRGNRNLNQLFFFLAVSQCSDHGSKGSAFNGLFAEYYIKKMAEGKTKKQAIKCIMRRLVNIIFRLMKDKCEYIPPDEISKSKREGVADAITTSTKKGN